jgi:hypothetical protein
LLEEDPVCCWSAEGVAGEEGEGEEDEGEAVCVDDWSLLDAEEAAPAA